MYIGQHEIANLVLMTLEYYYPLIIISLIFQGVCGETFQRYFLVLYFYECMLGPK